MCGIAGIVASKPLEDIVGYIDGISRLLENRGEEYAGFFCHDSTKNQANFLREKGRPKDIFQHFQEDLRRRDEKIISNMAIGHTRYKTKGVGGKENAQPVYFSEPYLALCHNGHVSNYNQIKEEWEFLGKKFNSDNDAEAILAVASYYYEKFKKNYSPKEAGFQAIYEVMERVQGAFTALMLIPKTGLFFFRDKHGFRPGVYGLKKEDDILIYGIASESIALEQNEFSDITSIKNGSVIFFSDNLELEERILFHEEYKLCPFEFVYFSNAPSTIDNISVQDVRFKLGEKLADKIIKEGVVSDINSVTYVPHTPIAAAEGCVKRLKENGYDVTSINAIEKLRSGGRTFLKESQEKRASSARLAFFVFEKAVKNKNIFIIDDSIIRGTNSIDVVSKIRQKGARKVYFGSTWPMNVGSCYQGIDTPEAIELFAYKYGRDLNAMKKALNVDGLFFNSIEDIKEVIHENICLGCLTGIPEVKFCYSGKIFE